MRTNKNIAKGASHPTSPTVSQYRKTINVREHKIIFLCVLRRIATAGSCKLHNTDKHRRDNELQFFSFTKQPKRVTAHTHTPHFTTATVAARHARGGAHKPKVIMTAIGFRKSLHITLGIFIKSSCLTSSVTFISHQYSGQNIPFTCERINSGNRPNFWALNVNIRQKGKTSWIQNPIMKTGMYASNRTEVHYSKEIMEK